MPEHRYVKLAVTVSLSLCCLIMPALAQDAGNAGGTADSGSGSGGGTPSAGAGGQNTGGDASGGSGADNGTGSGGAASPAGGNAGVAPYVIQQMVQGQKEAQEKADAEKAKDAAGDNTTPAGSGSTRAPAAGGEPQPTDAGKKDAAKTDAKADAKEKSADAKKDAEKKEAEEKAQAEKEEQRKAAAAAAAQSKQTYDPLKDAIFQISSGNYHNSIDLLTKIVQSNSKNVQAHYLLAVSYVGLRQYQQAADQYNVVIKLAPKSKVGMLAAEGLKKIAH